MKKFFKKIWDWIVYSSANAQQVALTVKGFLYGLIPAAVIIFGLTNVKIGSEDLTEVIDTLGSIIVAVGGVITSVMFIYGFLRKIILTLLGKNKVLIALKAQE